MVTYFERNTFMSNLLVVLYDRTILFYGMQRKTALFLSQMVSIDFTETKKENKNRTCVTLLKCFGDGKQFFYAA